LLSFPAFFNLKHQKQLQYHYKKKGTQAAPVLSSRSLGKQLLSSSFIAFLFIIFGSPTKLS
jgi:hypothetical protein